MILNKQNNIEFNGCDWSTVRNRIYENPELAGGTQKGPDLEG